MSKKYNYNGDWDWTDLTDPIPNEIMEKFERNMCPTDYDYDDDFEPVAPI